MKTSALEAMFLLHVKAEKLEPPEQEYRFVADRRWRFDFAWPAIKLAVEIEGGIWNGGRHTRAAGFIGDCEKYNRATVLGWRVLRFTGEQVKAGTAIATVREAIG